MLTRRDLIKYAICAGALLWSGPMLTNCSGLKRGDLPEQEADTMAMPHLDESVRSDTRPGKPGPKRPQHPAVAGANAVRAGHDHSGR